MGKISSGCDIVFQVGDSEPLRMGTTLSYGESTIQAIARALMSQSDKKEELRDLLKYETSTKEITKEELEIGGLVYNATVFNLVNLHPDYDWSNLDQSVKLLMVDWMKYYGEDYSNKIIVQYNPRTQAKEKIIVINPTNKDEVKKLHQYLTIKSKLANQTDEINDILSSAQIILEQLPSIKEKLKKDSDKYEEYDKTKDLTPYGKKQKDSLLSSYNVYKLFDKYTPSTIEDLIMDYFENGNKYIGLSFNNSGYSQSISSKIDNIIKQLEGRNIKGATYSDVFANEINQYLKPKTIKDGNSNKKVSSISKAKVIEALQTKLSDLETKASKLKRGTEAYKENQDIQKEINQFLDLKNPSPDKWRKIINYLIELSDDEFSYEFYSTEGSYLYLQYVPKILEERYDNFSYQTISTMKLIETYKGYNIYQDEQGKFYCDRHIITTKSYSKKLTSLAQAKQVINQKVKYDTISKHSLIEFKTMEDRNVVYLSNMFVPGQVLKVLDMHFDPDLKLNETEQDLIYSTGENNSNTLENFYQYILDICSSTSKSHIESELKKYIDTAEKAACFIYALNAKENAKGDTIRKALSLTSFLDLIKLFKNPNYKYYVIEEVSKKPTTAGKGFKDYITVNKGIKTKKGTYRTLVTPIPSSDISNCFVSINDGTARPNQSIVLLNNLAQQLNDKLGIQIHVETQSNLEDLFREWGEEMPSDVHGFIRNGEIYLNSSTATDSDFFHEYTHLMLGVLKSRNYDNYYDLVNLVGNSKDCTGLKNQLKQLYPNLADTDLNEEVFAAAFGKYLSGYNFEDFLEKKLNIVKQAVIKDMESIFDIPKLPDDFYYGKVRNIFAQFSYDLRKLMQQPNGLEINSGKSFRQATNWIESQIKKYKENEKALIEANEKLETEESEKALTDESKKIGVKEICD